MNKKVLVLENISVSFNKGKTYAFKDISFSVNEGEILSIIWLNWSWKTTLLKTIAWIQKLTEWKIIRNYKKLYYVPQKINVDPKFPITVKEFINIYNDNYNFEDLESYLNKFSLNWFLEKNISLLSWWEMQKIFIISWLLSRPDLLLLDEPTSSVDAISEKIFYEIINDIKIFLPNIAIILVSHNINLVYKNSDKVICLHENNFCCHWESWELKNNKKINEIFWEYVVPYQHNPHEKHKEVSI